MKITTSIEIKPWKAPNFAVPQTSESHSRSDPTSIPVADLDQEALDDLVLQWIADLYKKAGKRSPFPREFAKDICA